MGEMDGVLVGQLAATVLRSVIVATAGDALIHHGIWTSDNASENAAKVAAGLIAIGWSLYQKWQARQKLVAARLAPAMPLDEAVKK
jgi:hypothetical protein